MAKPVTITCSHQLGKRGAYERVKEGFGQIKDRISGGMPFTFEEEWHEEEMNFSARGLGQNVTGRMLFLEEQVMIEVMLPDLLAGMADAIAGKLKTEGQRLLDKR